MPAIEEVLAANERVEATTKRLLADQAAAQVEADARREQHVARKLARRHARSDAPVPQTDEALAGTAAWQDDKLADGLA